jgi:hypothetical protein
MGTLGVRSPPLLIHEKKVFNSEREPPLSLPFNPHSIIYIQRGAEIVDDVVGVLEAYR